MSLMRPQQQQALAGGQYALYQRLQEGWAGKLA